jgi:hypothetical protein
MTTGATIHTTNGLVMIATPRQHVQTPPRQDAQKGEVGRVNNGHAGNGAVAEEIVEESIPVIVRR